MWNYAGVGGLLLLAAAISGCEPPKERAPGEASKTGQTKPVNAPAVPRALLERASTVELVKVTATTDVDDRPVDGDFYRRFEFEILASSGKPIHTLNVPIAYGGLRPGPPPELPTQLKFDSLEQGKTYWLLFGADYDPREYPYPVMGWWPAAQAPQQVIELAKQDAYRWQPTFHPQTGLTYGLETISPQAAKVIVKRDGVVVWSQAVAGAARHNGQNTLVVYEGPNFDMAPINAPKDERPIYLLYAEAKTDLAKDNPFEVPAGGYRVRTAWQLGSGKRLAEWVLPENHPNDALAMRQYDDDGKLKLLARYESLAHGGLAVGAPTEAWLRKTLRRFNASGHVVATEVFRHGSVKDQAGQHKHNGWVLVSKE